MRILVTGSRDWTDDDAVHQRLEEAVYDLTGRPVWDQIFLAMPADFFVVHGDYKKGVDRITRLWCEGWGVNQEPHPPNWRHYGRGAGPKRNQEMVDLGADVCLAFPLPTSIGTWDCMERARRAGIPIKNYGSQLNNMMLDIPSE